MPENDTHAVDMLRMIDPLITQQSSLRGTPTEVPRLTVWSSATATPQYSSVFEPMFYAVLRGKKALTMGANRFELLAGSCAVSSFGLPYSHEVGGATPSQPYVGVSLHLDTDLVTEVALLVPTTAEGKWTCAVSAGSLDGAIGETFARLLSLTTAPNEIGILGPAYEKELIYRLLRSPMSQTLRQVVKSGGVASQIKSAADRLAARYHEPVSVSELAQTAGMSVTSFHRHFKALTGYSPVAFQHQMRLLDAQKLLWGGGETVTSVAYRVGFQSPPQFSREYRRKFGHAPVADLRRSSVFTAA